MEVWRSPVMVNDYKDDYGFHRCDQHLRSHHVIKKWGNYYYERLCTLLTKQCGMSLLFIRTRQFRWRLKFRKCLMNQTTENSRAVKCQPGHSPSRLSKSCVVRRWFTDFHTHRKKERPAQECKACHSKEDDNAKHFRKRQDTAV